MSGGSLDYGYRHLDDLADEIEKKFVQDGKYTYDYDGTVYDRLQDPSPEQRPLMLAEVRSLISDLRRDAKRAKALEWLMSGDHGPDSYLKAIAP